MADADEIIAFLNQFIERHNKTYLSAKEAAELLDRAGILKDSTQRPGKPLRDLLRKGLFPHAYQLGDKGSHWIIPQSHSTPARKETLPANESEQLDVSTVQFGDEYESLRARYRPSIIRVLMVGESRPAQGTFFYQGDSVLFYHTCDAFCRALKRTFGSSGEFLNYFMDAGYFLDDICSVPVNRQDRSQRNHARQQGVPTLAQRIRAYSPETVICLMKSIAPYVQEAVRRSGVPLKDDVHVLSFPTRGRQDEYVEELATLIRRLER